MYLCSSSDSESSCSDGHIYAQSLDYDMTYLYNIPYNGKNGFPLLYTVPKRVQKITSGNKIKVSDVKDCLHILRRGKDVEKGKQEKS